LEVAAAPTSVDRVKVIATTTQIVSTDYGAIMMDGGILIIAKPDPKLSTLLGEPGANGPNALYLVELMVHRIDPDHVLHR